MITLLKKIFLVTKEKVKEGSWMEKWSQQGKRETSQAKQKPEKKPSVKNVTVPTETVMHLYQLYGTNYVSNLPSISNDESTPEQSTLPKENDEKKKDIKKITADLADVEFDDF